jgi:HrpA-like RNA helicase
MMKGILEKRPEFRLILMSATVPMEVFKTSYENKNSINEKSCDIAIELYSMEGLFRFDSSCG